MPTSNYMPDVQVEIAFTSGYTTPDASRVWTDVSPYVELADNCGITFGRQDELSVADANDLTLVLDNSDGRFTAGLQYMPNRVLDPSMKNTGSWSPLGSPGFTISTNGNAPGETNGKCLQVGAASAYREVREPAFPVTPGDQYRVQAYGWVQSTATGTGDLLAAIWFFDSAGAFISAVGPTWSPADAGAGWIQREATGTVPAGAVTARAVARITAGLTSGAYLLDAVKVQQVNPYYPNVKVGRPIRVTATPPGGTASRRFVGFINQWPVEWDSTDAYAKTTITATSRLSRLGLSAKMRSMPEAAILAPEPRLYWTLSDPSTTTAAIESAGASGGGQRLLRTEADPSNPGVPVVFGDATGPGTDGLTAATFNGTLAAPVGQYLQAETLGIPAGPRTIRASVRLLSLPNGSQGDALLVSGDGLKLGVDAAGLLRGATTTGPSVNDGLTHDVALTLDGTTERLYLDGALVHSVAAGTPSATNLLTVGALANVVLAHVAVYETALTGAQIADQAETMAAATVTERTDERLSRILGWVGVAASEISTQTGAETMTYQQTSGMSVVDALRECESTEGGVLFDGRDGRVTFHNRSHRYTATVAATFDMAAQQVEADYAPKLDRSTLTNDVTVENPTTGESARSTDSASVTEYGVATSSAKSVASTYDPLQQKAAWLVYSHAEPRSRVPSLTVDVLAQQGEVNWITNPSFETDTSGWFSSNGTLARVVTASPQGSASLAYTSTASVAAGNLAYTAAVAAAPGEVWTASCWLRMITQSSAYRIYVRFYDSGGSTISQGITIVDAGDLSLTSYTRISATGTAPAGTASVRLLVFPSDGLAVGNGFRVDGAMLTRGPELLDYFDGSSTGCEWSGTAHASPSFDSSPSARTILGLTVGSRIQVTNQPAQADATTADYFIEGYSEAIGPESYRITFNLSPAHPSLNTFVIGDPVRGAIETGGALAL